MWPTARYIRFLFRLYLTVAATIGLGALLAVCLYYDPFRGIALAENMVAMGLAYALWRRPDLRRRLRSNVLKFVAEARAHAAHTISSVRELHRRLEDDIIDRTSKA